MPFEPVLTEDGSAVQLDASGWPLVKNDKGEQVAWDVNRHSDSLHASNEQAKGYREFVQTLSRAMEIEGAADSAATHKSILERLDTYATEQSELAQLRGMRDRGELDEDAEAKWKQQLSDKVNEVKTEFENRIKAADAKKSQAEAAEAKATASLHGAMQGTGLAAFFDACVSGGKESKLPALDAMTRSTFLMIAGQPDANGYAWRWNGKYDTVGTTILVRTDATGQHIAKGPDNIEPLTLAQWAETDLRKTHPIFFKARNGSPDLDPSNPSAKAWTDMDEREIAARVDAM